MTVNMEVFKGFAEQIQHLSDFAQPTDMPAEQRVAKAKAVFLRKLNTIDALDLESCVHCGMCAQACHFFQSTHDTKYIPISKLGLVKKFYRRELSPMRWLHRLYTKEITAQELQDYQELVYDSCTECARCSLACPMGVNIAGMVKTTREALAEAGLIPADMRAVVQEQCAYGSVFGAGPDALKAAIKELTDEGIPVPLDKEKADVMVLTSVVDILLFKDAFRSTVRIMNSLGLDWTFRSCAFEGANFGLLSGYEKLQKAASDSVIQQAINCRAKVVIVPECGHAYPALRWEGANEYGQPLPFEVFAISEFLGREIKAKRLKVNPVAGKTVTYHDPCKLARHGGIFEEPRDVFKALGIELREMECHGVNNWCCGGGAGVFVIKSASKLRQSAFKIKMRQVNATGADSVVTSCGSCRLNFLAGATNAGWNKNIESLVELVGANLAENQQGGAKP